MGYRKNAFIYLRHERMRFVFDRSEACGFGKTVEIYSQNLFAVLSQACCSGGRGKEPQRLHISQG
jgi:hypothetical protein